MIHAEETMGKFEMLKYFEQCYESIKPAQENSAEAFAWFSGLPNFFYNPVMHICCEENVSEKVDSLIEKAPANTPISFWVHSQNQAQGLVEILNERGFKPVAKYPLMAWKVKSVAKPQFEITSAKKRDFHAIVASVFHLEGDLRQQYEALLDNSKSENFLAYADTLPITKPVGTGTIYQEGKIGGIFNVATIPQYQKKGYGRSMMLFLMNEAHQRGLEYLVLLSSPEAEKMYIDLGFQKAFDVEIYAR